MPQLIPADWMPAGKLARVIVHWTAGAGFASAEDRDSYHVLVDRVGHLHRGEPAITDNLNTAEGDYAAHVRGLNSGSIGLALCGMAGAHERPFAPGRFPLTKVQWNRALIAAAALCRRYGIAPNERGLLMHCEVQRVYGIPSTKWDISLRTWGPTAYDHMSPGEELRERVALLLGG